MRCASLQTRFAGLQGLFGLHDLVDVLDHADQTMRGALRACAKVSR